MVFPEPKITLNQAQFGDVKTDPEARRKMLKAFAKAYIETYIDQFLEQNKIKEDLFPSSFIAGALKNIDNMSPEEVLKFPDDGYVMLKKAMDDSAARYYDNLIAGPKVDQMRNDVVRVLKEAEKKSHEFVAEKEKKLAEALEGMDKKYEDQFKALGVRVASLEARSGITPPSSASSGLNDLGQGLQKRDRMLVFAAIGLSILSIFLSFYKKS